MIKKRIIFHIGSAKCASTSIQNALSSADDIDYIGFCPNNINNKFYSNDDMGILFDRVLRFTCQDEIKYKNLIDEHITNSTSDTIVFSSENITLRLLPWDLPTHIKLQFIKKIFPKETEFIYIVKHPQDMLISIYKEWILMGYSSSFKTFINELYEYEEISLFSDLLIGNFLDKFSNIFNLSSLNLFFLDQNIFGNIESVVGRQLKNETQENKSISNDEAVIVRDYNSKLNDYTPFFDSIELHRAYPSINDENRKFAQARKRILRKSIAKSLIRYSNKKENLELNESIINLFIEDVKAAKNRYHKNKKVDYFLTKYLQKFVK